jgi:hypothetical protein
LLEFSRKKENPPETYVTTYGVAILYARLAEKGKALEWLNKGYLEHDVQMTEIGVEPAFDVLRLDPRFVDLLRRVHIAP